MNIQNALLQHVENKKLLSDDMILSMMEALKKNTEASDIADFLITLLKKSNDVYLSNGIALIMEEQRLPIYRKPLLEKYFTTPDNYRGTLLFACSSFDNSEDCLDIIKFITERPLSAEEQMSILQLFQNMKDLKSTKKQTAINHLKEKEINDSALAVEQIIEALNFAKDI